MSRKRINNGSIFNKILAEEGISVKKLHKQCIKMGYKITYPNVNDAVNHTRNFTIVTMCKLIYALRVLTGKEYTFNDCFEMCEFTDLNPVD
jgi:hypothetical protein